MHEAGLAASVAEALRRHGLDQSDAPVRVTVHGGHDDAAGFDDALRLHLGVALPGFDMRRLAIGHAPREAVCGRCGELFQAASSETRCPTCGAEGLILPTPESIELEWSS